jgi:hypothetical protein
MLGCQNSVGAFFVAFKKLERDTGTSWCVGGARAASVFFQIRPLVALAAALQQTKENDHSQILSLFSSFTVCSTTNLRSIDTYLGM